MKMRIVVTQSDNLTWWAEYQVYENKRYRIKEQTNGSSPAHAISRLTINSEKEQGK